MSILLHALADCQTFPLFGTSTEPLPYLYVIDRTDPGAVCDPSLLRTTIPYRRWAVVDRQTGLSHESLSFDHESQAHAALTRILSDCPDRAQLMERGSSWIRVIEREVLASAPIPAPETETATESEPDPAECPNCHSEPDDCSCDHCEGCDGPCDSACSHCNQCDECCECAHCGRSRCGQPCDSTCDRCDRCPECCECSHCDRCGDTVESTCPECDRCDSCCHCFHCENCGERSREGGCSDCDRCDECGCQCHGPVKFEDRPIEWHDSESFELNPSRRYISAELEISSSDEFDSIDSACDHWSCSVVEDGSLPTGGFEINTSPAQGDRFPELIRDVARGLADDGAEISTKCGYHVHVDARDFGYADIVRLIEIYARIEPALFSIVAPSRRDNHYCAKCGPDFVRRASLHPADPEDSVARAVYCEDKKILDRVKRDKYNHARYAALNLHSYVYRGTVECRLHQGTTDPEKIVNWGILWAGILDFAKDHSADELPSDPMDALLEIAPTTDVRQWVRNRRDHFANR